jgi:hypothetical protein
MALDPLVEIRSWLHRVPWLWNGLLFLGRNAPALMLGAACWIGGLTLVLTRRSGPPTGAVEAEPRPLAEEPPNAPPAQ